MLHLDAPPLVVSVFLFLLGHLHNLLRSVLHAVFAQQIHSLVWRGNELNLDGNPFNERFAQAVRAFPTCVAISCRARVLRWGSHKENRVRPRRGGGATSSTAVETGDEGVTKKWKEKPEKNHFFLVGAEIADRCSNTPSPRRDDGDDPAAKARATSSQKKRRNEAKISRPAATLDDADFDGGSRTSTV